MIFSLSPPLKLHSSLVPSQQSSDFPNWLTITLLYFGDGFLKIMFEIYRFFCFQRLCEFIEELLLSKQMCQKGAKMLLKYYLKVCANILLEGLYNVLCTLNLKCVFFFFFD